MPAARGSSSRSPRRARFLAAFADQFWTVDDRGLERWALDGRSLGERVPGRGLLVPTHAGPAAAAWGDRLWLDDLGSLREVPLDEGAVPFASRRTIIAGRHRGVGVVRLGTATWGLPPGGELVAAAGAVRRRERSRDRRAAAICEAA